VNNEVKNRFDILRKSYYIPGENLITETVKSFSLGEKVLFGLFAVILAISSLGLLLRVNRSLMVEVPSQGGSLVEGVVGFPRFINPLIAISDADKDLASVIYSGLMKVNEKGELISDLAEKYEISDDGKTYTFTLKDNLEFHDGEPVTSADILFTIKSVQNELLKSPKRPNWIGVEAESIDERTIVFHLKQPYAPFLDNATLGILPKHIWQNLDAEQFPFSQFNIEPVGSGPYKLKSIKRNSAGVADYYDLRPFSNYALKKPYISTLAFRFFSGESELLKAYAGGDVDSINSINPQKAKEFEQGGQRVEKIALTRIFGLFLNQNQQPIFADKEVRQALEVSLNRERIINEVLYGYATSLNGPLPPGLHGETVKPETTANIDKATSILEKAGWKKGENGKWSKKTSKGTTELAFSISTADAPELSRSANIMKESWEALGAVVDVKIFESGTLNQTVIRPRKYDSLFFGEIIGRDLDLFAFWHSSQRNDPGLNVSLYTNLRADKLLEEARALSDKEERRIKFTNFEKEVREDVPAIFAYAPDFIYILPEKLRGFEMSSLTVGQDRFNGISNWYIDTDYVWNFINAIRNK
jgi:peptide/nickel transport system substrate-binding protein